MADLRKTTECFYSLKEIQPLHRAFKLSRQTDAEHIYL